MQQTHEEQEIGSPATTENTQCNQATVNINIGKSKSKVICETTLDNGIVLQIRQGNITGECVGAIVSIYLFLLSPLLLLSNLLPTPIYPSLLLYSFILYPVR
jgi:hypothetical protein